MERRFPALLILWLGREFYRAKYGILAAALSGPRPLRQTWQPSWRPWRQMDDSRKCDPFLDISIRKENTLESMRKLHVTSQPVGENIYLSGSRKDLLLIDHRNAWFQHDAAPPHKVSNVQQYIRDTFQQQVIGYGGCVEWPPRAPDLNPLDFFLWGYIKQRVYSTPSPTLKELRNRITDACARVSPAMLYNMQREVQSRVQMCIVAEGPF
ncbi:hypothetical protein AVEN_83389-1 [Araneus ventricosus]|uniref:Tc1-like transposase DDE domain-containing protein n=1 Tax=Araneus ventricosus TaxID=182803 RepID=A0A4Y2HJM2_ARAVE|nr:hypothetical protein AVEN_83389-1 [Araneus ventricosus]